MNMISLEQWRALVGVVDNGSYMQAANSLGKSQSSISYAIGRIEERLRITLFTIEGRKAVLSNEGRALYLRAKQLLAEAGRIEKMASELSRGHEVELLLAVDILFPADMLVGALKSFVAIQPATRLEIHETAVTGAMDLLKKGRVDMAIAPEVPDGFLGEQIMNVRFLPVAAPSHPLHQLDSIMLDDLRNHHHLIIRDNSENRNDQGAWNVSENRIIFSQISTAIEAARSGLGFSWYAETLIEDELATGKLKVLPLAERAYRSAELFLIFRDVAGACPGVKILANLLREQALQTADTVQS
jgi:DNA-binding transcriptional LysR family regulator